jgi:hypothetical protein
MTSVISSGLGPTLARMRQTSMAMDAPVPPAIEETTST